MDDLVSYLEDVLEQLIRYVLEEQEELKRSKLFMLIKSGQVNYEFNLDKGILAGHYIVIERLFKVAASLGIFETLPKVLQRHITPATLMEDLKKGNVRRLFVLRDTLMATSGRTTYGYLDLKSLLEELNTEAQALQKNATSPYDRGKFAGYCFCLLTLYNQVKVLTPELIEALPKELRDLNLEPA